MTNKNDDDVGYCKPPKSTQFQPGQSGNPKGRPKGTRNLKTDLQEELAQPVQITVSGKTQTVSKQRALIMRLSEKGLKGDHRSIELMTKLTLQLLDQEHQSAPEQPLSREENDILASILNQQRAPIDEGTPE